MGLYSAPPASYTLRTWFHSRSLQSEVKVIHYMDTKHRQGNRPSLLSITPGQTPRHSSCIQKQKSHQTKEANMTSRSLSKPACAVCLQSTRCRTAGRSDEDSEPMTQCLIWQAWVLSGTQSPLLHSVEFATSAPEGLHEGDDQSWC